MKISFFSWQNFRLRFYQRKFNPISASCNSYQCPLVTNEGISTYLQDTLLGIAITLKTFKNG